MQSTIKKGTVNNQNKKLLISLSTGKFENIKEKRQQRIGIKNTCVWEMALDQ